MDKLIKRLEGRLRKGAVPGTAFNRVIMGTADLPKYGLRVPKARRLSKRLPKESYVVWGLSFGEMSAPKEFYYGHTMREALLRALDDTK